MSGISAVGRSQALKDVRAHCYCAFLLRTLFIRHARATGHATSYIKHAHWAKHLTKCSADGRCINLVREYFCWMHGDSHLFFGRSLPFLIISIITKNKTILYMGSLNYFTFTVRMGSNCYINIGVRDLEVALFKDNSTWRNGISSKNLLNLPIYTEMNSHNSDIILHFT